MLPRPATPAAATPRSCIVTDPRNEVEFFYLRPATSPPTSAPARSTSASPAATCCSTPDAGAAEIDAPRLRRAPRSASPARPAASPTLDGPRRACASPPATPAWSAASSTSTASRVDLVHLDGAVESAVRLGVADAVADVVSTGTTLAQAGLEIFGPVILESSAVLIAAPTSRRRARHAAAPAAGRAGGPPVRAHGLRPPRGAARRGRRARPGHRVADRLAAARPRLGRGARDGARATTRNHDHGRALRARRPRDPGHARSTPRGSDEPRCAGSSRASTSPTAAWSRASTSRTCATPGDPVELAARYFEQGADELTFLDVTATVDERATTYDVVRAHRRAGLHPADRRRRECAAPTTSPGCSAVGADKVGVNTAAIARPALIDEIADRFGAQVLVLSLDVKRSRAHRIGFVVTTHGGRTETDTRRARLGARGDRARRGGAAGQLDRRRRHEGRLLRPPHRGGASNT